MWREFVESYSSIRNIKNIVELGNNTLFVCGNSDVNIKNNLYNNSLLKYVGLKDGKEFVYFLNFQNNEIMSYDLMTTYNTQPKSFHLCIRYIFYTNEYIFFENVNYFPSDMTLNNILIKDIKHMIPNYDYENIVMYKEMS